MRFASILFMFVVALFGTATAFGEEVKHYQYQVSEFSFQAENEYKNPLMDVQMQATFKSAEGKEFVAPAFWDGGKTWKVRFTPPTIGKWTFSTTSQPADNGLNNKSGEFSAEKSDSENPLIKHGGFLRVSKDKHYLTYDDGTPFFWLGDTWWFCPSDLMPFDTCYKKCIDKRAEQGYTVIQMAFLGELKTSQGVNTFNNFPKTNTLNPEYWQKADKYIEYANQKGIMPVFGLSFHAGMDGLTLDHWKTIWKYALARYSAYSVSFLICGEYNLTNNDLKKDRVPKTLALGQFIKDTDPYKRAMTVHPWWHGGDKHQAWNSPWYDFIIFQGGHGGPPPTSLYTTPYNSKDVKPVLEAECCYEGIHAHDDAMVREVSYRAIQSGSFGFTYGVQGLWYPTQNEKDETFKDWGKIVVWDKALEKIGGDQMKHLKKCYESVEWWNLKPVENAIASNIKLNESQKLLVKADGDKTVLVYFSRKTPDNLKAQLTIISKNAKYSGQWFNPRTGETADVKALEIANNALVLPDRADKNDWMLIIRKIDPNAKAPLK